MRVVTMDQTRFQIPLAVDVETLIARIRERVREREAIKYDNPSTNGTTAPFMAQAEFNHAMAESLLGIAASLEDGHNAVVALEERLQHAAETQVSEESNRLSAML